MHTMETRHLLVRLNASGTWHISRNMEILIVTMYISVVTFSYLIGVAQIEKYDQERFN